MSESESARQGSIFGLPRWPVKIAAAAIVLGLTAWSLWQRWRFLGSTPYPTGIDGYFYPIQLRSLLDTGSLYYPTSPLALWLMAPFAAFSDPITGAKLGAAAGNALIVIPVYILGRRIGGSFAAGILAAALVATSAESMYLTTEFVKNAIGLTMAATYLCVLAWTLEPLRVEACGRFFDQWSRTKRIAVALVVLAAVVLTHKLAAVLAAIASIPPVVAAVRSGSVAISRRLWMILAGAATAGLLAMIALGIVAPDRFPSLDDLALLGDLWAGKWHWTMPALAVPGQEPMWLQYEVALAAAVSILALALQLATRWIPQLRTPAISASDRVLHVGPALVAIFAALPMLDIGDPQGLAFRLRLIGFVALALSSAALARAIFARVGRPWSTVAVIPFVVAFAVVRPITPSEGVVEANPAMLAAVRALDGVVPGDHTVVVPERHILFMVTWHTGNDAVLRPESAPAEKRWRLLPLNLMSPPLRQAIDDIRAEAPPGVVLPRGLHPRHRNGLVVMPEATWQWIFRKLPEIDRDYYERWPTI